MHIYSIWEIDQCQTKFGCDDVDLTTISQDIYDKKINEECKYSNSNYFQIELQAASDLVTLELYTSD